MKIKTIILSFYVLLIPFFLQSQPPPTEAFDVNISNPRVDGDFFKFELQIRRISSWFGDEGIGDADFYFNYNDAGFTGNPMYSNLNSGISVSLGVKYDFLVQVNSSQLQVKLIYIPVPGNDYMWIPQLDAWETVCTIEWEIVDPLQNFDVVWNEVNTGVYSASNNYPLLPTYYGIGSTSTYNMSISSSWNMIGLPLQVDNGYYLSLFPSAIPSTLYGFNGGYVQEDTLKSGEGYWLRFSAPEVVNVAGYAVTSNDIVLTQGWNMITGISCNVALSDVSDPGGIIIPGTLYGFAGGYTLADSIKQGNGYWIRANANGTITLECIIGSSASPANPLAAIADPTQIGLIEISDVTGASQKLFFNAELEDSSQKLSYSMPPVPVSGIFDARFEEGYRLIESSEGIIEVQTSHYPLTVHFSNLPPEEGYTLEQLVNGEAVETIQLKEGESIEISNSEVKQLRLSKLESPEIPTVFTVHQNYPNPFNPKTVIKYAIPTNEKVEIIVYNTLGQKVKTLISKDIEAGFYEVVWDATNDYGNTVGSGIYFYRVKAGKHNAIKKMVLIR